MKTLRYLLISITALSCTTSIADENIFGYVKGAETLPAESWEVYQSITQRTDKGIGDYEALNLSTEVEYGFTDRLTGGIALNAQSIDTQGIIIDGYLPKDESYSLRTSGVEAALKYNFLSPAKDDFGLAGYLEFSNSWLDPHSGQDKDTYSVDLALLMQKYFLEGQLIWAGNVAMETTYAKRDEIENLPVGFEWPTEPEMEIELSVGTGLSYRVVSNWFIGAETIYETEFETEVGQERWSWFAGPSIHYGSADWWLTLTYFKQLEGGKEQYPDQADTDLHLIEKTKQEIRAKIGFNF
ncbi:MAG: hypothetical protein H0W44_07460 [Gammaproteobacteria bacterium]|nr:hypothetical protein [Gammaproteobacteria bacterium]